jgi:hypothetical protein
MYLSQRTKDILLVVALITIVGLTIGMIVMRGMKKRNQQSTQQHHEQGDEPSSPPLLLRSPEESKRFIVKTFLNFIQTNDEWKNWQVNASDFYVTRTLPNSLIVGYPPDIVLPTIARGQAMMNNDLRLIYIPSVDDVLFQDARVELKKRFIYTNIQSLAQDVYTLLMRNIREAMDAVVNVSPQSTEQPFDMTLRIGDTVTRTVTVRPNNARTLILYNPNPAFVPQTEFDLPELVVDGEDDKSIIDSITSVFTYLAGSSDRWELTRNDFMVLLVIELVLNRCGVPVQLIQDEENEDVITEAITAYHDSMIWSF